MFRHQLVVRYLGVMAAWWITSGVLYIATADKAGKSAAFAVVDEAISLEGWGVVMIAVGALCLGGWLRPKPAGVRIVLSVSLAVKWAFAVGLFLSWTWTPGFVSYLMLAALDALMISQPYIRRRVR